MATHVLRSCPGGRCCVSYQPASYQNWFLMVIRGARVRPMQIQPDRTALIVYRVSERTIGNVRFREDFYTQTPFCTEVNSIFWQVFYVVEIISLFLIKKTTWCKISKQSRLKNRILFEIQAFLLIWRSICLF